MELLFIELKRLLGISDLFDQLWIIRRQLAVMGNRSLELQLLEKTMKAELQAGFDKLEAKIAAESLEAQEAIKEAVAVAVLPLKTEIEELKQALEEDEDVSDILANIDEAIASVDKIVESPSKETEEESSEEELESGEESAPLPESPATGEPSF